MESSPVKILQQIKRRVQSVTYGSPIYRMMLDQGPVPERLRLSIPDLWPGDAKRGQTLIASQPSLFEMDTPAAEGERRDYFSFEPLRDLRAVGSDLARRKAVSLIHEWIDDQQE
ncbi:MAG TPA: heparinase, partial [Rhodospirillaceae bacterium]|nr:heparinase [Rhodospirillaceae bacterium]